ncbi:hypothetical protein ACH47B_13415 [Rhodococcus sp. NPDC019627]|uniref:hypothetical protein n=1 Tax=unclassified Rhodococcus (in: high G+C Gram-positive bacteria) TaxID=192944 RepID=UPI00340A3046
MVDYLNHVSFARGFATILAAAVALVAVLIGALLAADVYVMSLPSWFGSWPVR